jgi:2-oxoglutarate dehydrogenase E2 component (dihydrolipoamide succinyltransferase)
MREEIRVQASYATNEIEIKAWYKKVGDRVVEGDPLVEYETDKVTIEVPAPVDGVLAETLKQDGEKIIRPDDASETGDWSVVVGYVDTETA